MSCLGDARLQTRLKTRPALRTRYNNRRQRRAKACLARHKPLLLLLVGAVYKTI